MRKVFFVLICFTAVAAVHAADIHILEFRGQRYLYLDGADAWDVIIRHASGQNLNQPRINSVISNNRINIIMEIPLHDVLPMNIRRRNYIQNGDLFGTVVHFNSHIEIIYRGQRRDNIRQGLLAPQNRNRYAFIGYAQGGVISILEIVTRDELVRDFRLVE